MEVLVVVKSGEVRYFATLKPETIFFEQTLMPNTINTINSYSMNTFYGVIICRIYNVI